MRKYLSIIIIGVAALALSGCVTAKYDPENYQPKSSKLANLLFGGAQNHPYDYYPNHTQRSDK
jgi:hypothetical protein